MTAPTSTWLNDAELSFHLLKNGEWLNDGIINAYLEARTAQARPHRTEPDKPGQKAYFLHSYSLNQFRPNRTTQAGRVRRPLKSDLNLMPVNDNKHWYFLVIYKQRGVLGSGQYEWVVCFFDCSPLHSSHDMTLARWIEQRGYRNKLMVRKERSGLLGRATILTAESMCWRSPTRSWRKPLGKMPEPSLTCITKQLVVVACITGNLDLFLKLSYAADAMPYPVWTTSPSPFMNTISSTCAQRRQPPSRAPRPAAAVQVPACKHGLAPRHHQDDARSP